MTLPRLLRVSRQRLRSLVRKGTLDTELDRELAFHFDALVSEKVADGLSLDDARAAARRELGNAAVFAEESRDQRRVNWFHDFRQDLAYGWRMLRRHPGFTWVAVASLALGIGANSAILGAIDATLLQDPALPHGDRVVVIKTVSPQNAAATSASMSEFLAWRDRGHTFEAIGASMPWQHDFGAEESGLPAERVPGLAVTPGWFATLGARPLHGRTFTDDESRFGETARVVVISHRLWTRRFAADLSVITRTIRMNGVPTTIIGVMPRTFRFQDRRVDCWTPLGVNPRPSQNINRVLTVLARLKPGITIDQGQGDVNAIAAALAVEAPERQRGWGARVVPLGEMLYGWAKEPLLTLQAAVALVLLIACANVGGLLLARGLVRRREIGLRTALGAGRGRLFRQLLTESLLLSGIGGLVGVVVAALALRALSTLMSAPPGAPQIAEVGWNARWLVAASLLSVCTGLGFGLAPAFTNSRLRVAGALSESATYTRRHGRGILVSAQIALAVVLLVGASLLVGSFIRLATRDLNFDPSNVLTFDVQMSPLGFTRQVGMENGVPLVEVKRQPSETLTRMLERLQAIPGAESAGGISFPHVNSLIVPKTTLAGDGQPTLAYFLVTPGYFRTMRTAVVSGREFDVHDVASAPWVAMVNESAARRLWPDEDSLGRRVRFDHAPDEQPREVVGVVRDIPLRRGERAEPVMYASYLQQPGFYRGRWGGMFGQMTFVVRGAGDPMSLLPAARRAIAEVDPNRPLANAMAMAELGQLMRERRAFVTAVGAFACIATLLSAMGVFGVVAYSVSQRTREIGIRKALGATSREIVRLVGRAAIVPVAAGLVAGLAGALWLTRFIASQLWGVTPTDVATFAGVMAALSLVAVLAAAIPLRRAMAVDPTVALKD